MIRDGRPMAWLACVWLMAGACLAAAEGPMAAEEALSPVERDWLIQITPARAQPRTQPQAPIPAVSTREDAAGAVDGIKDGKWGFHTGSDAAPWWQVDLGRSHVLKRAVIYNRCDGDVQGRAARLVLLLSQDGNTWQEAYRHGGTAFGGQPDGKPLVVSLAEPLARYVRIQLPQAGYLHFDEVEVYGADDPRKNLALRQPADQSSVSQWSVAHGRAGAPAPAIEPIAAPSQYPTPEVIERGRLLAADLKAMGADTGPMERKLDDVAARLPAAPPESRRDLYFAARRAVRRLAFSNPLLDFDRIVFVKRAPPTFTHMSDQYYGWWSQPGGGLYVLEDPKGDSPHARRINPDLPDGSFLRPDLSWDGRKVLFAWCRYYPHVSRIGDKVNKDNLPEDAFYHVFEMNVDGTGLRQLTRGKYDDFDARYLPGGDIVFLSTRRGQFLQCGRRSAEETLRAPLPNSYVRCGGDNSRPVAIYTLHTMDASGSNLRQISPFENFEWTPSVTRDGRILYARWDYVDRHNMPFMSLWSTNPDGTNPQGVYGNFTRNPHCIFEARAIPGSNKLIFTASAHHSVTGGCLVLLDPDAGQDGGGPITRLTPEVCFPESEGWPATYFVNPYPLSERYYLVAWSPVPLQRGDAGGNWGWKPNGRNALGLYLFDAFGNLELLYRDPEISSQTPLPLRPRPKPSVYTLARAADDGLEGRMVLLNVYRGLAGVEPGTIEALRIVAVPAKTQPQMNSPNLGVTRDDPGKCVLGTVPVEPDGSAYFRLPAGVIVFFQALDNLGRAVQTMRTVTSVQPGETLSCIGCHEPRTSAPPPVRPQALGREPSRIAVGPPGSWPLRFDALVQPVLDRHCVRCHKPGGDGKAVARLDLTPAKAYASLLNHGGNASLARHVQARYNEGRSIAGQGAAQTSPVLAALLSKGGHHDVRLDGESLARLIAWMDTYGQRQGSFSPEQEAYLAGLRESWADMLTGPGSE